jgi:hypothetical protein
LKLMRLRSVVAGVIATGQETRERRRNPRQSVAIVEILPIPTFPDSLGSKRQGSQLGSLRQSGTL